VSAHFANWDDRTLELAVDHLTMGLDDRDLQHLRASTEESDLEQFEFAVAAVQLSGMRSLEAPPKSLSRRLEEAARSHFPDPAPSAPGPRPLRDGGRREESAPAPALIAWSGWLAAAIVLVVASLRSGDAPPPTDLVADAVELRDDLIRSSDDLIRLDWSGTEDPLAAGVSGDVVWSVARQEGYMRFASLAPNDPTDKQYQLWIFDKSRADFEAKPVDGGVFDVGPDGEVVVPIDAKLDIGEPVLFAVTLEEPGGVVVSERERLVLTAAL